MKTAKRKSKSIPRWLPVVGAVIARVLGSTWRMREFGPEACRPARADRGERFVYALWHRTILINCYQYRDLGACIGVSEHGDGEIAASIAKRMGFLTARGSSTRGAMRLLREMVKFARNETGDLALTPDGPKGPACRCKPGVIYLASRLGWRIVPAGAAARPCKVFRSWDRFQLPYPFARVITVVGEPIEIPSDVSEDELPGWCDRVDRAMAELEIQARTHLGLDPEPAAER